MDTRLSHAFLDSRGRIQVLLTVTGAIGIPAIFLPFTFGTSPLAAAWSSDLFLKDMWRIADSCTLKISKIELRSHFRPSLQTLLPRQIPSKAGALSSLVRLLLAPLAAEIE